MSFPGLTPFQELVLSIVGTAEIKGRHLRLELAKQGFNQSGPVFYQLMSRLEEAGFIEGWYERKIVTGQIIKERTYKVTGKGRYVFAETLEYYRQHIGKNR